MVSNELDCEKYKTNNTKLDGATSINSFYNRDGLLLRTYSWIVKGAIGIFVLVHGLNSHIRFQFLRHNADIVSNDKVIIKDVDDYYIYKDSWIEKLNEQGYSVYGLDLQGHGESEGWENLRTNVKNFDDLVYDFIQYINIINDSIQSENEDNNCSLNMIENCMSDNDVYENNTTESDIFENVKDINEISECETIQMDSYENIIIETNKDSPIPIYIMGLSMGGNIVLRALQLLEKELHPNKYMNIKGCICLSGMIMLEKLSSVNSFKFKGMYDIMKFFGNHFPKNRLFKRFKFSKHPYINDLIYYDKLRYQKWITGQFAFQLFKAIENLREDINYFPKDMPLLFIHSKDDSVCSFKGAMEFFNDIDIENKEFYPLDIMEHLLPIEPGNEQVLGKILDWISNLNNNDNTSEENIIDDDTKEEEIIEEFINNDNN
ncbi:lysophospholipase, putative [Plasmodium sp. DRC-Itaito]|uniref:Lysophospholipase, putative n=1 Tax=Plasmodium gaboni TaxID=647221 RepID=A0ABY1UK02_9APIC|nr:lysophospholipase, putative [Plasmodium gaboni]SOV21828.1 lysophospholipase, putative [Plasmodium sp. DRC-Itaito]